MVAMNRMALASLVLVLAFGVALAQVSDPDTIRRRAVTSAAASSNRAKQAAGLPSRGCPTEPTTTT